LPEALTALGFRWTAGGAYRPSPQNRRARSRRAEPASNPCSPFAHLKALTLRS
jgi:hypothetical protein